MTTPQRLQHEVKTLRLENTRLKHDAVQKVEAARLNPEEDYVAWCKQFGLPLNQHEKVPTYAWATKEAAQVRALAALMIELETFRCPRS
jgi:hypothetical protein